MGGARLAGKNKTIGQTGDRNEGGLKTASLGGLPKALPGEKPVARREAAKKESRARAVAAVNRVIGMSSPQSYYTLR